MIFDADGEGILFWTESEALTYAGSVGAPHVVIALPRPGALEGYYTVPPDGSHLAFVRREERHDYYLVKGAFEPSHDP